MGHLQKNNNLSRLGFGTWGIGGDVGKASGYGPTNDQTSLEAIDEAVNQGISFFDTAPPYGNGKAEELIGKSIKGRRDNLRILTKIGVQTWNDQPLYSPQNITDSINLSMRRMEIDYLDFAIFHSLKKINLSEIKDGYIQLIKEKKLGKVRKIGFSIKSPLDIIELSKYFDEIDVIEANFNLLDTRALDANVQDIIKERKIFFVARTPLAFGFLTEAVTDHTIFPASDHRSRWSEQQRNMWNFGKKTMKQIFAKYSLNFPIEDMAINYCMSHQFVDMVIPGMLSKEEVRANIKAVNNFSIPVNCLNEIKRFNDNNNLFIK